jgi:hypothetical protein
MFDSTQPSPDAEPGRRVKSLMRYFDGTLRDPDAGISRLSSLSPSLMQDLMRFEQPGRQTELLEVIAAAIRHARALTVQLRTERGPMPLTIFPEHKLLHCPLAFSRFIDLRLTDLEVVLVEPAVVKAPAPGDDPGAESHRFAPLGPLTWELALRGARGELLPEISSQAGYRIPPGADLKAIDLAGTLAEGVKRLKRGTTNLREMSSWPGFDRERAMRLLNALYLQAALMVTRTSPAATNDAWEP